MKEVNEKLVKVLEELRERFRDIEINYNCIDVVNISMDSQIKIDEILAEVKGD